MAAAHSWAGEMLGNFVGMHVPMIDLDEQLHRAL
jgi:hypothetical protein